MTLHDKPRRGDEHLRSSNPPRTRRRLKSALAGGAAVAVLATGCEFDPQDSANPIINSCQGEAAEIGLGYSDGRFLPADPGTGSIYNGTEGDDVVVIINGPVTFNGLGGNDTVCIRDIGLDNGAGEITVNGGDGDDVVINDGLMPVALNGGAGNDILFGSAHDDRIDGGPGVDTIAAGGGADQCTTPLADSDALTSCETVIKVGETVTASASVAEGGSVKLGDAQLVVPSGVMDVDGDISVTHLVVDGEVAYDFEIHTGWDGDVLVTVPADVSPSPDGALELEALEVNHFNVSTGVWEAEPAILVDLHTGTVTAAVDHLSVFSRALKWGLNQVDKLVQRQLTEQSLISKGLKWATGRLDGFEEWTCENGNVGFIVGIAPSAIAGPFGVGAELLLGSCPVYAPPVTTTTAPSTTTTAPSTTTTQPPTETVAAWLSVYPTLNSVTIRRHATMNSASIGSIVKPNKAPVVCYVIGQDVHPPLGLPGSNPYWYRLRGGGYITDSGMSTSGIPHSGVPRC